MKETLRNRFILNSRDIKIGLGKSEIKGIFNMD